MAKSKFYVVWKGAKPGVYSDWKTCQAQIAGFPDAQYKSFESKAAAEKAFTENPWKHIGNKGKAKASSVNKAVGQPIANSFSVDAACSGNPGLMEYQGVLTGNKKLIFRKGPFKMGTNNVGEFLALVHILALLKKHNDTRPVYSDSKIAIGWVQKKKHKSKLKLTPQNAELFDLLARAEKWLANNDYPNQILKWETKVWGEIPADFGRK